MGSVPTYRPVQLLNQSQDETRGVSGITARQFRIRSQRPRGFGRRFTLDLPRLFDLVRRSYGGSRPGDIRK